MESGSGRTEDQRSDEMGEQLMPDLDEMNQCQAELPLLDDRSS